MNEVVGLRGMQMKIQLNLKMLVKNGMQQFLKIRSYYCEK